MRRRIFTEVDLAEMWVASDFRYHPEGGYITPGITPNLVVEVYSDWLDEILRKWNNG